MIALLNRRGTGLWWPQGINPLRIILSFWIICGLLLSGCSVNTKPDLSAQTPLTPPKNWELQGKLGIKQNSQAQAANIRWQTQGEHYHIHLHGTLGLGKTTIVKDDLGVTLSAQGKRRRAHSAQALSEALLDISLPVEQLQYWVFGLAYPHAELTHIAHTKDGHLATLSQAGWQLDFSRYQMSNNLWLPHKIIAKQDNIRITLIIKSWTL